MRRTSFVLAMLAICAVVLSTSFYGDNAAIAQKEKTFKGRLPNYWGQLGLSKEQITQIYKLQVDYHSKVKSLEDQIKQLKDEEKTKLLDVLTELQQKQLRVILLKKAGIDPSTPKNQDTKPNGESKD